MMPENLVNKKIDALVARGVPRRIACNLVIKELVLNANVRIPPRYANLLNKQPASMGCRIIDLDQVRRSKQSK